MASLSAVHPSGLIELFPAVLFYIKHCVTSKLCYCLFNHNTTSEGMLEYKRNHMWSPVLIAIYYICYILSLRPFVHTRAGVCVCVEEIRHYIAPAKHEENSLNRG